MRWLWLGATVVFVLALVALGQGIYNQIAIHDQVEACKAEGHEWVKANGHYDCYDLERVP